MRIKPGYQLKKTAQHFVVMHSSEDMMPDPLFAMNETGVFLWEQLQGDVSEEMLVKALLKEYELESDMATEVGADVKDFIEMLQKNEVLAYE